MKKKGIRSSAVAGLLACALTMSLIPVQSALAQPTGSEDSMRQSIEKMVQNPASYTVSLDLEGGTIPDLSDEGWTQSGDDVWTTVLTQEQIMSGGGYQCRRRSVPATYSLDGLLRTAVNLFLN